MVALSVIMLAEVVLVVVVVLAEVAVLSVIVLAVIVLAVMVLTVVVLAVVLNYARYLPFYYKQKIHLKLTTQSYTLISCQEGNLSRCVEPTQSFLYNSC